MNIDTRIEILSLSFMWIFAAVFFIALLLSYKRLGYIYLKIAVLALFAELVRQTASDFTLLYPVAPFYAASSCAFVIEALLFLATVASAAGRKLGPRPYVAVIVLYAASLIFMGVWFDPAVRWHQYISYSPALAVHFGIVYLAWKLYRGHSQTSGWLLASSAAMLGTRLALPWLSTEPNIVYGFFYFADGILFSMAFGSVMLIGLEQIAGDRTRSLEDLRRAESELRFLLDNSEDVIISHAEDGTLLSWNNRAQALFGYEEAEVVDRIDIAQLISGSNENLDSRREAIAYGRDGRNIPIEVSRRNAKDGDIVRHTLVIRDLSTVREIEARQEALSDQLREIQKLESLGVLAAGIAHDFNNLLASIMGHAEIASKQLATSPRARHAIDQVLTAADRASEITDQMLTYAGKADFHPIAIDLNALIGEIVTLMRASIHPDADFELDLDPESTWIYADRAQITQVLINLISNASDALCGREGTISIATTRRQLPEEEIRKLPLGDNLPGTDYVVLEVQDDGAGMPEEVRSRVFEPFFSTKFAGRGLGLAAVAGIIKKHQAAISVASRTGHGTRFTLYLPARRIEEAAENVPGNNYVPVNRGLSVLLVDDLPDMLDLCERILASAGHRTTRAGSGREALSLVKSGAEINVIILDCTMPGKNGPAIYNLLIAEGVQLPVVFVGGFNLTRIRSQIGRWPATLLKKPFLADELLEAVDRVTDRETSGTGQARK